MASHVPPHSVLMDLGCGRHWLRPLLDQCQYIGVDYRPRSTDTLVCDFNRGEFPDKQVDVCFVSGCLEYLDEPDWFIGEIAAHAERCIISYCILESNPDVRMRAQLGWKNNLKKDQIISLFAAHGMRLEYETTCVNNSIFIFKKPNLDICGIDSLPLDRDNPSESPAYG